MEISERCKKRLDDLDNMIDIMKKQGITEPYIVVVWDTDIESIIELDLSYQDNITENHNLKKQIEDVKRQTYDMYSHKLAKLQFLEAENNSLRNTIKNMKENFTEHLNALEAENHNLKEQVIDGLNKERRSLHNTINILRADNSNQSHDIHKLEAENKRLKDQVAQLRTIKKSFEVLRALYLGDYENDEPF